MGVEKKEVFIAVYRKWLKNQNPHTVDVVYDLLCKTGGRVFMSPLRKWMSKVFINVFTNVQ